MTVNDSQQMKCCGKCAAHVFTLLRLALYKACSPINPGTRLPAYTLLGQSTLSIWVRSPTMIHGLQGTWCQALKMAWHHASCYREGEPLTLHHAAIPCSLQPRQPAKSQPEACYGTWVKGGQLPVCVMLPSAQGAACELSNNMGHGQGPA